MLQELTPISKSIEEIWKLDGLTDYQKTLVEKILESNKPKERRIIVKSFEKGYDNARENSIGNDEEIFDGEVFFDLNYK